MQDQRKSLTRSLIGTAIIIVVILGVALLLSSINNPETLTYDQFVQKMEAGQIDGIYIGSYSARVHYANDPKYSLEVFTKNPKRCDGVLNISSRVDFTDKVESICEENGRSMPLMKYDDPSSGSMWSTIIPLLIMVGLGVLLVIMFRQGTNSNNQAINFGKTKARLNQDVKVRFSDVAGAEEEKEELQEIVDFLKAPKRFKEAGARIPKGVLLVGEPGTGKTLFAKAVAGEANVAFFSISGSDFVEMFVGVGASRVRDLFAQAQANKPCIIFIDEIDAVGRQRGAGLGGGHDEREQTLNQLLVQMDGFETSDGIIIMAATNRADILDPALLRPGRFDRRIYVHVPDVKGREAIFKVHARNKNLDGSIDFRKLARLTSGFTGADIENLLNEAAILAARSGRKNILMADILEGIDKVVIGPQKKSRIITESDKRITAYHESGHAIIAHLLEHCDDVQEVSIVPRGMAAGYTLTLPDSDDSHVTKNQLNDMITMMLGGRAAEELVIRDISTGASNDIQRATSVAKNMVTEWGMSEELGNPFWGTAHEVFLGRDYQAQHSYSEEVAGKIDAEITRIINANYERAKKILSENRSVMDNMVKMLYERETIYATEVKKLFEGMTAEEILADLEKDDRGDVERAIESAELISGVAKPEQNDDEEKQADVKSADASEESKNEQ